MIACFFFFLSFLVIYGSNGDLSARNLPRIKEKKEQTTKTRKHQGK